MIERIIVFLDISLVKNSSPSVQSTCCWFPAVSHHIIIQEHRALRLASTLEL